jgi:hypothetical protein
MSRLVRLAIFRRPSADPDPLLLDWVISVEWDLDSLKGEGEQSAVMPIQLQ